MDFKTDFSAQPELRGGLFYLLASLCALGWLIPVHSLPWTAFHQDAWVALLLLCASFLLAFKGGEAFPVHRMELAAICLAAMVWLQLLAGAIPFVGEAWTASAYCLGFALAVSTGWRCERRVPGLVGDFLFLAIVLAAIASVGLQLWQCLELDASPLWLAGTDPERLSANLGQANQMATLLLWGELGLFWAYETRRVRGTVVVFAALFLLLGVVLSGSRTAWLGQGLIAAFCWYRRSFWRHRLVPWMATGALPTLMVMKLTLAWLLQLLMMRSELAERPFDAAGSGTRWHAWRMFIRAVGEQPWLGYGWRGTLKADLQWADQYPQVGKIFSYAHNLFLDFVLWFGIPLGLAFAAFLSCWMWRRFQQVDTSRHAIFFMVILVTANHAMLEMPLYYAYFLLPVGLMAGVLQCHYSRPQMVFRTSRAFQGLWLVLALLFALLVNDYFKVEERMTRFRLHAQNFSRTDSSVPDLLVLKHWNDVVAFNDVDIEEASKAGRGEHWRDIVYYWNSPLYLAKLAKIQWLAGDLAESQRILKVMSATCDGESCAHIAEHWCKLQARDPRFKDALWPGGCTTK